MAASRSKISAFDDGTDDVRDPAAAREVRLGVDIRDLAADDECADDPLDAHERQRHPCAQPRLCDAGDGGPRHAAGIALCVPDELGLPRKNAGRDGFGDGIPAGARQRECVTAAVAWRIIGSMLREDRDGTCSLIEVQDRHPVVGDQSLELPRETL